MINYYLDPGQGFVFAQGFSWFWAMILAFLGSFLFFFRFIFGFFKKFFFPLLVLLLVLTIGGIMIFGSSNKKNKFIILGIDAMDPKISERLIQEGRMPNFSALKRDGAYSALVTPMPTETVVSWASFATGLNPGGHGLFDFVMRDPKDYSLYLSLNEISNSAGKVEVKLRRKGKAFWDVLSQNKIPSYVYFCPNTFPAEPFLGRMLSGMGVTDITGTMGKFSFYTTRGLTKEDRDSRGRIIPVEVNDNLIRTRIYGPKVVSGGAIQESSIALKVRLNPDKKNVIIELPGKQIELKEGSWSGWQGLAFKVGFFKKARGIFRFYLKSIEPEFQLYLSPINLDPRQPLFPISYPADYSRKIAEKTGLYYTQGMPYDTWALSEGRLDEKAFLELSDEILRENEKMLEGAIREFKGGVLFYYLETLDIIQHMFWRYLDTKHPLYEDSSVYKDTVFKYYERIDRIVGEVLKGMDKDTVLIVLSDHGFASFRKSINLNRWLLDNNYLKLKEEKKEGGEFFEDVDWPKTRAYSLGFGGVYLNKIGRESSGIVPESEANALKQEIASGLEKIRDPKTAEKVIHDVYFQEDIFQGAYSKEAPDLFVGFSDGFRASWQTALGAAPEALFEDNRKKWSGDHLIDSSIVPGVIFINRKIELSNPSIVDILPTMLDYYGISKPESLEGKVLFKDENK